MGFCSENPRKARNLWHHVWECPSCMEPPCPIVVTSVRMVVGLWGRVRGTLEQCIHKLRVRRNVSSSFEHSSAKIFRGKLVVIKQ